MPQSSILRLIEDNLQKKDRIIIAIDGRCAAGKSTLAKQLCESLCCPVIHMDDFFLQPQQRTKQRLETPGGNIDHERFLSEVLIPLEKNIAFSYRLYDCHTQTFCKTAKVMPCNTVIVEGSYSCHPFLWDYYDIHVFADIDPKTQMRRIALRNGENAAAVFRDKWIPLEEKYFSEYKIREKCEICV